ncbi:hypothetical protein Tsubulata_020903 [Turnera subulata]|uniref:60S ribosomal protein L18a-like protein n=1 Tax=Turnera subulata TaxID=218843 RepID=A0A9Q0FP05_9ROSI|nr:hypothetical protein Tsubulata_020903 [Turnera subulata]
MSGGGENKGSSTSNPPGQFPYGTFQGVANYYPPPTQPQHPPVVGFPQPVPPYGATSHPHGYQAVATGYAVVEARPAREGRLPCCGLGMGWFLFLVGFVLGGIPWYVGTFVLLCVRVDHREKPGYIACAIAVSDHHLSFIFFLLL